jgi:quercetin dioxygenase-like cupin family protein
VTTYHLSLLREQAQPNMPVEATGLFGALWIENGRVRLNGSVPAETRSIFLQGRTLVQAVDGPATWLRFALTDAPVEAPGLLNAALVEVAGDLALLRLDTVTFPPGACAWRHVHPGAGIRYLRQGELALTSDSHETTMRAGDSWFEPAETPVRATASAGHPKTGFVRFMVLPVRYLGKPSIRILDESDAERPRLQVTQRHLDHVVRLPQG